MGIIGRINNNKALKKGYMTIVRGQE